MKRLTKIVHFLDRALEFVAAFMMGLMVLIVFWQVFGRYVLHKVPAWSEEMVLLLMMWYGFLSISLGFRYQHHLKISFVVDRMPAVVQKVLDKVSHLLSVAIGFLFLYEGYKFAVLTWSSTLPVTKLPSGVQYLAIPISGLFILLYGLYWLFNLGRKNES